MFRGSQYHVLTVCVRAVKMLLIWGRFSHWLLPLIIHPGFEATRWTQREPKNKIQCDSAPGTNMKQTHWNEYFFKHVEGKIKKHSYYVYLKLIWEPRVPKRGVLRQIKPETVTKTRPGDIFSTVIPWQGMHGTVAKSKTNLTSQQQWRNFQHPSAVKEPSNASKMILSQLAAPTLYRLNIHWLTLRWLGVVLEISRKQSQDLCRAAGLTVQIWKFRILRHNLPEFLKYWKFLKWF